MARGWFGGEDGERGGVEVEGAVLRQETDDALLVEVDGEDVWLPKSQVLDRSGLREAGDVGCVTIPRWLARDRGLE